MGEGPFSSHAPTSGMTPKAPVLALVGAGAQTVIRLQELWGAVKIAIFSKGESRWKLSYGGGMAPTIGLPTSPTPTPDVKTPPNVVCLWFFAI